MGPSLLLHGKWDLPRPGIEPVSSSLAGGFLMSESPGKPGILLNCFESDDQLGKIVFFMIISHKYGIAFYLFRSFFQSVNKLSIFSTEILQFIYYFF